MKCEYCGLEMDGGLSIGTGTGSAHAQCWYLRNPFVPKHTFTSVLWNLDDQVVVRDLLLEHVPQDVKNTVVREFNEIMSKKHQDRMVIYEQGGNE